MFRFYQKCTIPNRKVRSEKKKIIPTRKKKIFQIDNGKHSNYKKEIIPIRKKILQLEK